MKANEQIGLRLEALTIALALAEEHKIALTPKVNAALNAAGALFMENIRISTGWTYERTIKELKLAKRRLHAEYDARRDPLRALIDAFAELGLEVDAKFVAASNAPPDLKTILENGSLREIADALGKLPPKGTV